MKIVLGTPLAACIARADRPCRSGRGGRLAGGADLFGGPFGGLIWDQYLIQSPQADGLHQYIPDWLVPPRGSEALLNRSF